MTPASNVPTGKSAVQEKAHWRTYFFPSFLVLDHTQWWEHTDETSKRSVLNSGCDRPAYQESH